MTLPSEAEPVAPPDPRAAVRRHYAQIATSPEPCCGPSCCGGTSAERSEATGAQGSQMLGYAPSELAVLPEGADLGLGCGNPTGLASLSAGERVVDLGSGAGIDCFLAAQRVGPTGSVVGVDMTPEMLQRARDLAAKNRVPNVEFRLGEIEHLPLADASVDVVLSNCVINLSNDKRAVFAEAFRVLRPGGRLVVADMIATRPISAEARADLERWSSCSSGAETREMIAGWLQAVGFESIRVEPTRHSADAPGLAGPDSLGVVSGTIEARKPGR